VRADTHTRGQARGGERGAERERTGPRPPPAVCPGPALIADLPAPKRSPPSSPPPPPPPPPPAPRGSSSPGGGEGRVGSPMFPGAPRGPWCVWRHKPPPPVAPPGPGPCAQPRYPPRRGRGKEEREKRAQQSFKAKYSRRPALSKRYFGKCTPTPPPFLSPPALKREVSALG